MGNFFQSSLSYLVGIVFSWVCALIIWLHNIAPPPFNKYTVFIYCITKAFAGSHENYCIKLFPIAILIKNDFSNPNFLILKSI